MSVRIIILLFSLLFPVLVFGQTSGGGTYTNHQISFTYNGGSACYPYQVATTTGSVYSCIGGVVTLPLGTGGGSSSLTVGTTPIASGTNTYLEYNNNGKLGEIPQSTFVTGGPYLPLAGGTMSGNITGVSGGYVNYKSFGCENSTLAGTAVGTGTTPSYTAQTAGTIVSATITGSLSAGNCSCIIDVWKANAALPTVTNTITAGAYPTLSTGTYNTQSVATWSTSVAANDVIMCNVNSCTCDNWNLVLGIKV
jgi:hypothetical protein